MNVHCLSYVIVLFLDFKSLFFFVVFKIKKTFTLICIENLTCVISGTDVGCESWMVLIKLYRWEKIIVFRLYKIGN